MNRISVTVVLLLLAGCSSVHSLYVRAGYAPGAGMVKHVVILASAPENNSGLGPLVARIAMDIIKLRKNYLVHGNKAMKGNTMDKDRFAGCGGIDGVLVFTVTHVSLREGKADLVITGELYRCSSRELVWRAEGKAVRPSMDPNLVELTKVYETSYGSEAAQYAAPAFGIIQDIVETLPDPVLSDEEVLKKIEMETSVFP